MTSEPPGRYDQHLVRFRASVEELLDLALELRWKLAHEADSAEAADLERLVGEIGERVARWREQLRARPALEAIADERLRHAENIVLECAAIVAERPSGVRAPAGPA